MRILLPLVASVSLASAATACASEARPVDDAPTIRRQTRDFEKSLAQLGLRGRLHCSQMIELVQDAPDYSYGAICELASGRVRKTVMLCDDTLVGKFTIKIGGFTIERSSLIAFTRANCPGGA